jgi:hypothetical protein
MTNNYTPRQRPRRDVEQLTRASTNIETQNYMKTRTPTESVLRRKAARRGYKLTKIRDASRWYNDYGPFMISEASTNCAVQCGMTADEVNGWLTSDEGSHAVAGTGEVV